MCLQCLTDAITIKENVLPGFTLMLSQKDAEGWPKGAYGLVELNDPTVVFAGPLLKDPTAGMSDNELNALRAEPEDNDEFFRAADELGTHLILDAVIGHRLVQACVACGFSTQDSGHLRYWLMHHLATQVEAKVL
ncbi:hypothetical protein [Burkholderia ubonensis]|nr:hypothetical protein [Burkholderia ubonensis]